MFHIVLAADDSYIKYAAVLISSIIKCTETKKSFKDFFNYENELGNYKKLDFDTLDKHEQDEGYVFHILSEDISLENQNKLDKLAFTLSSHYPCEIKTHKIHMRIFADIQLNKWGENRNFTTYFRLLIPSLIKECKTCLYLDTDMLVLKDIRELFSLNLQGYTLATVQNQAPFGHFYNAGFLLFNLELWRLQDLQGQCLSYLQSHPNTPNDQSVLNAIVKNNDTLKLPLKFNYWLQTFNSDEFKIFNKNDFKDFKAQTYIIHYIRPKPWRNIMLWLKHSKNRVFCYQSIVDLWWQEALQTPIFKEDLQNKKYEINDELSDQSLKLLSEFENSLFALEKDKKNLQHEFETKTRTLQEQHEKTLQTQVVQVKNQLSYMLGQALIKRNKKASNNVFKFALTGGGACDFLAQRPA